ncbi:ATP-sulfurylase [Dunaliella salina]|uniref:ATP-sulfurylase n=1 Tax=Dunaliella salina TaxID=3046 RepID=A0ABQ7G791_DUNSA|nr:ATP-sulfurylase [Dunaliella salina]|eukprot:KAF5830471.1 ATP-sulfurylase [Dunaliella salina]
MVGAEQRKALEASSTHRQECSDRNACDVELLSVGAFSPLTGFMNKDVYEHNLKEMRLPGSNLLFGLPVVLDTHDPTVKEGSKVLLEYKGQKLGLLEVESKWSPDKALETKLAYGTSSLEHPGVRMVAMERGHHYIGGKLHGFELPKRWANDDIPGIVRYKTYEVLREELNNPRIKWAYLPYSMHMAGPREAIQHMLLRKNYGCTHFIVGRDMAGSKSSITTCESPALACTSMDAKAANLKVRKLSGTDFRKRLRAGEDIPDWFAFK